VPVLSTAGNRRLALAGLLLALVAFGVFFAVGRGGREPTRTTAVRSAPETDVADTSPAVGAVTGTSGAIPALKPPPAPKGTTGAPATTGTATSTTAPATTGTPTTGTSGTGTSSPPPTSGTSGTSSPPPTSGTTTTN
jgi:hypothetical protein